jgi:hypothetical protein
MSEVANCPTCQGKSKIKNLNGVIIYDSLQDESIIKKVSQLKKTLEKFKLKADQLEQELITLNTTM